MGSPAGPRRAGSGQRPPGPVPAGLRQPPRCCRRRCRLPQRARTPHPRHGLASLPCSPPLPAAQRCACQTGAAPSAASRPVPLWPPSTTSACRRARRRGAGAGSACRRGSQVGGQHPRPVRCLPRRALALPRRVVPSRLLLPAQAEDGEDAASLPAPPRPEHNRHRCVCFLCGCRRASVGRSAADGGGCGPEWRHAGAQVAGLTGGCSGRQPGCRLRDSPTDFFAL